MCDHRDGLKRVNAYFHLTKSTLLNTWSAHSISTCKFTLVYTVSGNDVPAIYWQLIAVNLPFSFRRSGTVRWQSDVTGCCTMKTAAACWTTAAAILLSAIFAGKLQDGGSFDSVGTGCFLFRWLLCMQMSVPLTSCEVCTCEWSLLNRLWIATGSESKQFTSWATDVVAEVSCSEMWSACAGSASNSGQIWAVTFRIRLYRYIATGNWSEWGGERNRTQALKSSAVTPLTAAFL
jgi:hypothetical protein